MKYAMLPVAVFLASSASAQIQVVLCSQDHGAASAKAGTPGLPGVLNSNFGRVHRSPTTNQWNVVITTNSGDVNTDQVLVQGQGLAGTLIAQESVTPTENGEVVNLSTSLPEPRFNDVGQWSLAYRALPTTTLSDRVVRSSSGGFTTFARSEDHPTVPAFIDFWGFGTANTVSFSGVEVAADGSMGFLASNMAPNDLGGLEAIFRISTPGTATLVARVMDAATAPTGQSGPQAPWLDIDTGTLRWNAAGTSSICTGELASDTSIDRIAVVSGVVVAQEGSALPGTAFTSAVSTIADPWMESNGDWFLRGTNQDGTGWIIRNGAVIAQTGQPIFPGSTELWGSFIDFKGNNAGSYVVLGTSNLADGLRNSVIVANGQVVVVRESDPVDIDDNPNTPADLFIGTLRDRCTLLDDGYFYFAPSLKTNPTNTGNTTGNRASLLRVAIPTGPTCDAIDFNADGLFPDTADINDFLSVFSGGPCTNDPNCGDIDFNNDGLFPDTLDINALISVFSGGPCLI
ncbi:MAG TPA: hypothetical protein VHN77_09820 [Phycisphaerales bacterium]|nr:hypothetical protein [Phycisphaerales bacterium]